MALPSKSRLHHLYSTGELSDFKIATRSKDFKVHKNVIGRRSSFYRVTSTCAPQDAAQSDRIEVQEDESVIEPLLRYLYELEVLPYINPDTSDPLLKEAFDLAIKINNAARKYQVKDFKQGEVRAACCLRYIRSPAVLTRLCSSLFVDTFWFESDDLRPRAAYATWQAWDRIKADDVAWNALHSNEYYIRAVNEVMERWAEK